MNFELVLCLLTLISGILWGAFKILKRCQVNFCMPKIIRESIDFVASLFPIFLLVLVLRSFIYEPFVIPSGSLEPTLEIGDFVLVNKFDYGIRMPLTHETVIPVGKPKRGDIMVFLYPEDRSMYFIKRVIGLPGDTVTYKDKKLTINGKEMPQKVIGPDFEYDQYGNVYPVERRQEDLNGVVHDIFVRPGIAEHEAFTVTVPEGSYWVLGDNRDDSRDSRYWGFVPNNDIVGKAAWIWFSWDGQTSDWANKIRFGRMFKSVSD